MLPAPEDGDNEDGDGHAHKPTTRGTVRTSV